VPHHLTRDRRGRAIDASGDLRVGDAVGHPQRDLLAFLLAEPASWHRDLLGAPRDSQHSVHSSIIATFRIIAVALNLDPLQRLCATELHKCTSNATNLLS